MYRREEQIEEENLDWNQQNTRLIEETAVQEENVIYAPALESKKTLWQGIAELGIEKRLMNLVKKNMEIASFLAVLLLPYFVGFWITYSLFYIYADMSIIAFLMIEKEYILVQLWSLGAYTFVTVWLFWAFTHVLQDTQKLLLVSHR